MTKKRKRYPDLNQKLERPWCYYCDRDFDDLKILISHQKAKHFKCDKCGRRLNTAGGLSVHMTQVHKENLTHVENAIQGREGLDIEIFGMEGVPQDLIDSHNQQVTEQHFREEQERARITGNPTRGQYVNGQVPPNKRTKVKESVEEIKKRVAQFRTDKANGVLPAPASAPEVKELTPPETAPQPYGAPPGSVQTPFPPGANQPYGQFPPSFGGGPPGMPNAMPPRPGSIPGAGGLPQRPGYGAPPGAFPGQNGAPPGADASAISASVDELMADVQKEVAGNQVVSATEAPPEKKSKKDKNIKLMFFDESTSPEEKMAALPRFANFAPSVAS